MYKLVMSLNHLQYKSKSSSAVKKLNVKKIKINSSKDIKIILVLHITHKEANYVIKNI